MKNIIIVLIFVQFTVNLIGQSLTDERCEIIGKIFSESIFYSNQLNLSYVDTITILDKTNYFSQCGQLKMIIVDSGIAYKERTFEGMKITSNLHKTLIIKNQDIIPFPIIGHHKLTKCQEVKYENYFVLEEVIEFGELRLITMHKLISNHRILLAYLIRDERTSLFYHELGQY